MFKNKLLRGEIMYKRKIIDLRSDTVTKPTKAMLDAMYNAEVGDDVYGDDPTVNALEEKAAKMFGKEAALFVPSGHFGNQLAIMTHTVRGNEVIVGEGAHILENEGSAPAILSQVQLREVPDEFGYMKPLDIEKKIRKSIDLHYPKTGLICIETAHSNGMVMPLEMMVETKELADKYNLPVHLDGARVFNAATHLGLNVKELAKYADSISFCLSKGLCAPVGSIVLGTKKFIEKANFNRKIMGGGLRQSGYLAACGLVALDEMVDRLIEDHETAKYLDEKLRGIDELDVYSSRTQINMVFFSHKGLDDEIMDKFEPYLKEKGILTNPHEDGKVRFVTHYPISMEDIDYIYESINSFFLENK